jgi:hypothetical protein
VRQTGSTSTVRVTTDDNRCRQVRQQAILYSLQHHQTALKYGFTPHGATLQQFLACAAPKHPRPRPEVTDMTAPAAPAPTLRQMRKVVAASFIGTTIDWYDNSFDRG